MWQQLINWIRSLFGKETGDTVQGELYDVDKAKEHYEDTAEINFSAIFAASLADKALADSTMTVTTEDGGKDARSELIGDVLGKVFDSLKPHVAQALGKGGKFLIPYVSGGRVFVAGVDQSRCVINQENGAHEIISMSVIAAQIEIGQSKYQRIVDYTLENEMLTIKNRAIDKNGAEVELQSIEAWATIEPEMVISNVQRVPVAYLRCPKDSRREARFYGVPVTYGAEDTMRQLSECMTQIEQEYRLKRAFVGADETLFGKNNKLPSDGIFKKFSAIGGLNGSNFWEVFDPAIRDSSYFARYNSLCAQLEKEVGTSKGILTEPATLGATATEIKSANHATYCMVSDIRKNIDKAMNELAYSVDVFAEYFGLTPMGASENYKVTFDWDMSLIESSSETFAQMAELQSRGLISGARLNSWVTGQTEEEAQAEIDGVTEELMKRQASMMQPEEMEPEE